MVKPKKSAAARIKEQGKSLVWVTLNTGDKKKIRVAAAECEMPMSEFLRQQGLAAADKILEKMHNSH